ncbi:ribonuclease H-like domain-containing protein [Tanacetum coccineum]
MADFYHLDDARDIWLAVKARFGGNEESKKVRKSMLKQEFQEFKVSEDEGLHKGYDSLAFLLVIGTIDLKSKAKGGLDYLNFDDLYNKLKSLEIDIKGGSSYKSNHSVAPSHSAFVSTTSGNNKMSYAETSKQSSSYISASPGSNVSHFNFGNVMEDVLHSFVAESDQQIIYEDFDQIGKLDLEELDIKWQMAMLSVRVNRFEKKAGRKMNFNNRDAARFDKKKVICYKCSQLGHFARECTGKQVESNTRYSAFKIKELKQDKPADPKALLSVDSMVNWSDHEESADENASQVYGMIAGRDDEDEVASEFALMGVTSQVQTCPFGCHDKYAELKKEFDDLEVQYKEYYIQVQAYKNTLKTLEQQKAWYQSNQLAYEEKVKLGLGYGDYIGEDEIYYPTMPSIFDTTPEDVDGNSNPVSFYHLIKDCDFYENKMGVYSVQRESRPMWNNVDNIPPFIPQAAHGRSGNVTFPAGSVNMPAPIPAGRQTGPAPVYAGTPVPAVVPIDAGWTLILLVSLLFLLTEQLLLLVVHGSCCWFDVPTGSSVVPAGRLIFLLVVSCSYWLTTFPAGFEGY